MEKLVARACAGQSDRARAASSAPNNAERRHQRPALTRTMTSQADNQVKTGARTERGAPVRLHGVVRRVVAINTWAGRRTYEVEVVGETKTRYRVKALQYMMLPNRRFVSEGQVVLVPKSAVGEGTPTECGAYTGGIYGYAPNHRI